MGHLVAVIQCIHPRLTVADQPRREGGAYDRPRGDLRQDETLAFQVVLHDVPGQLHGVLKALDDTFLLQLAELPVFVKSLSE